MKGNGALTSKDIEQQALVRAAQAEPQAFDGIYRQYADPVYRYLLSRTRNPGVAEELTAQTFLAALEAFPRYRHRGKLAAWLFSIARNKSADHFRDADRLADLDQIADWQTDLDLDARNQESERRRALQAAIAELPEAQQELLRLRYLAELSFSEMGDLLGRNADAVKKSLYRLQARLRQGLEADHD